MRSQIIRTALIAGATLALAACGGGDGAVNNAANEADANQALEPLNDQSAIESVGNVTEPIAPEANSAGNAADTDPGDDGGETIETNTPGI
jgi:hypothetical protein